jgi:hypothetical protein
MLSVIAAVIRLVHAREQFRWVTRQRDLFRRDARGKAKYRCRRSVDYDLHEPGDLSDVWSRRTNERPPRLMPNHRRRASPRPRVSDRPVRGGQLQWIKRFETSARTNHHEDNEAGVGGVHRESQTWDAVSGTELVSMTGLRELVHGKREPFIGGYGWQRSGPAVGSPGLNVGGGGT